MNLLHRSNNISAFTLIELLVVIGIIAILMVTVVITMNPGQLLAQSRDSNRLSDIASMDTSLRLASIDSLSYGSTNTVYVSIPDNTATSTAGDQCQGLGLPSLPATYSYHCAASSTYRLTNGTGWIPVNMTQISQGTPLSQLPIDPVNTSSSRNYYTYTTNGQQFEVTMSPESQKYRTGGGNDVISNDGGSLASVYEKGTKLGLEPLDYGDASLVGYWTFDEGQGSTAYDYSGNNATGSWSGTATGTSGYYSPGKIGQWAGAFDGTSTYVGASALTILGSNGANISISFWAYETGKPNSYAPMVEQGSATGGRVFRAVWEPVNRAMCFGNDVNTNNYYCTPLSILNTGIWYHVVVLYGGGYQIFINGVSQAMTQYTGTYGMWNTTQLNIGYRPYSAAVSPFQGLIDDVRVYNRALSATEIQAMYNGNK